MKPLLPLVAAAVLALGVNIAVADTRSSDQDRATMEEKASPSAPVKQDEEQAESHSRPDTPASTGGSTVRLPVKGDDQAAKQSPQAKKPTGGDNYQSNENKADSTKSGQ
jgi:hypothetical protein